MENYWLMVLGVDEDEEKIESYYKEKYQKALEDMNIAIETLKSSKEFIKGHSSVETIDDFELNAQAAIVACKKYIKAKKNLQEFLNSKTKN